MSEGRRADLRSTTRRVTGAELPRHGQPGTTPTGPTSRPPRHCRAGGLDPSYRQRLVRPSRLVVGSVLIAALALVALPGLAGSRVPNPIEPLRASAFQPLSVPANSARSAISIGPLDAAYDAAGALAEDA